tara:strand:- start:155 stop:481 length:327 start_codon:yes stop_codon:yes gene_type:complete
LFAVPVLLFWLLVRTGSFSSFPALSLLKPDDGLHMVMIVLFQLLITSLVIFLRGSAYLRKTTERKQLKRLKGLPEPPTSLPPSLFTQLKEIMVKVKKTLTRQHKFLFK